MSQTLQLYYRPSIASFVNLVYNNIRMQYKNIKQESVIFCLSLVGMAVSVALATAFHIDRVQNAVEQPVEMAMQIPQDVHAAPEDEPFMDQARRLREELTLQNTLVPPASILANALRERSAREQYPLTVSFEADGKQFEPWIISLQEHPTWLTLQYSLLSARFELDAEATKRDLAAMIPSTLPIGTDGIAADVRIDKKVQRSTISGVVRTGFIVDPHAIAQQVTAALQNSMQEVTIPLEKSGGGMALLLPDGTTKHLTLLASGRSEFSNSPVDRVWNVKKAINEYINGIVIPQNSVFSFVDAIDAPVTLTKGWKEQLGLFGGGTAITPGGGICQAATTTYRAALLSGLPILKRRAHSMFVDHYEKYGPGMDATIFPGTQDLTFKNDTQHELILQAYTIGEEAFVDIYGVPDGRRVVVQGPYFNTTKDRDLLLKPLDNNQIGWTQRVTYSDGRIVEKPFISTYFKGFFKRVKTSYPVEVIDIVLETSPVTTAAVETASVAN